MIKRLFNSTNILLTFVTLIVAMACALGFPYIWSIIHLSKTDFFAWKKLGWGILIWVVTTPFVILYFHFKKPKKNFGKLASSNFMNDKEFKIQTNTYNYSDKRYEDSFVVKTVLKKKNTLLDISLAKKIGHSLVIGSTNSGKTALVVDPQIRILGNSINKPTMFISDPKGELFKKHSKWLQDNGYEVLSINLRNEKVSSYWNPLEKIWKMWKQRNEEQREKAIAHLSELSSALFPNETNGGKDSFFEGGANTVFQFFALALLEISDQDAEITLHHFNINNILNNIQQSTIEELQEIINMLPKNSSALQVGGRNVKSQEAKGTIQNLFQTVVTNLKIYNDPIIKRVTSKTTIKIDNSKPQAIFIIVPDETKAKYPFISLFVSETYKELIQASSFRREGKLERPIYYLLDEFGNLPKIPNMDAMLTVSRSRNIYFMLIIQNYAQLNKSYGKDIATTIIANCAIEYFILSNAYETAKRFFDKLGDSSLVTSSKSNSSNIKGQSSTHNESERTRRLIHPDELMNLKFTEMIIKIQRQKPIKLKTSEFYNFKEFNQEELIVAQHLEETNYDKKHLRLLFDSYENYGSKDNGIEVWHDLVDNIPAPNYEEGE